MRITFDYVHLLFLRGSLLGEYDFLWNTKNTPVSDKTTRAGTGAK